MRFAYPPYGSMAPNTSGATAGWAPDQVQGGIEVGSGAVEGAARCGALRYAQRTLRVGVIHLQRRPEECPGIRDRKIGSPEMHQNRPAAKPRMGRGSIAEGLATRRTEAIDPRPIRFRGRDIRPMPGFDSGRRTKRPLGPARIKSGAA